MLFQNPKEEKTVNFSQSRCYWLDWIRVGAILVVFLFHCLHFFDHMPWHVKNDLQSGIATLILIFIFTWIMPLFFFVSGSSSFFALRSNSSGKFLSARFKRLIIPYILGLVILIPPQKFLETVHHSGFQGNYLDFLAGYIPDLFSVNIGFSPSWIGHIGYHVWFLAYLFIFSALSLPLLRMMGSGKGSGILNSLAGMMEKRWGIWFFFIPIVLVNIVLRAAFPHYLSWADFVYFLLFFLYGYLFAVDKRFSQAIVRQIRVFLVVGFGSLVYIVYSAVITENLQGWMENPAYSLDYLIFQAVASLTAFSWMFFFIAGGIKFLDFKRDKLPRLNEAVLPFYVLHQTIILIIGFYVVQLSVSLWAKFVFIVISSFLVILLIYESIIRRHNWLRLVFGMSKLKSF
jgi:fucose 4-O-acetylase-like acetyltransferase